MTLKLSQIDPKKVQVVQEAPPKLSEINPEEVEVVKYGDQDLERMRPKKTPVESKLLGGAQGALFGFPDELEGLALGAKDAILTEKGFGKAYEDRRDAARTRYDEAYADNPGSYIVGNVAGTVATSVGPGILGRAAQGAGMIKTGGLLKKIGDILNIGKSNGVIIGGKLKKAAALGAGISAGTSTNNPLESMDKLQGFGKDVSKGALYGLAFQAGGNILGKGASSLKPSALKEFSNVKAIKSVGAIGSDLKNMSQIEKQEIGEELFKGGMVRVGQSIEDSVSAIKANKKEAGEAIGATLEQIDNLAAEAKEMVDKGLIPSFRGADGVVSAKSAAAAKQAMKDQIDESFQFSYSKISKRIKEEIIAPRLRKTKGGVMDYSPELREDLIKINNLADDFNRFSPTTLIKGGQTKSAVGKKINFNSETIPQSFKQEVYGIIKTELEDMVQNSGYLEGAVSRAKGFSVGNENASRVGDNLLSKYKNSKSTYKNMSAVEDIGEKALGRSQGNREISLTDTIAGVGGMVTGGAPAAIAIAGLNKLARTYGNGVMAVSARKSAEILEKSPKLLGRFAGVLEKAANQNAQTLAATHKALMEEPDYRRILDNFEKTAIDRRINRDSSNKSH